MVKQSCGDDGGGQIVPKWYQTHAKIMRKSY